MVLQFSFPDARPRERVWWLVVEDGVADLCRDDPGHELTLLVTSSVRALTDVWTGALEAPDAAQRRGHHGGRGDPGPRVAVALARVQRFAETRRRGHPWGLSPTRPRLDT